MKIAVNLRQYAKGKIGGLENYVRHVVGGIATHQASRNQPLTIFVHQSEAPNARAIAPHATIFPIDHVAAEPTIQTELEAGGYDLLFCPLLVLEPLQSKIPSAVMIPDLQHEFFPEFFDPEILLWRRRTYRPSAFQADVVFTLSEHAKKSVVERFRISPEKIEVIYLDVDEEFRIATPAPSGAFQSLQLPKDYLYFPANFWPHKNHSNLLRALRILRERHPELGLVLTGASSSGVERVEKEIGELGLQQCVRILGYRDREVVVELYRQARALVFASKFEGFGIPLLEAFHTGTPVITSNVGSCSEVAAGAALLIDPSDPADIAAGIMRVLREPELRWQLIEKGKARAQDFSWQRAIDLTLQSFDRITRPDYAGRRVVVQDYPVVSVVTPSYNMARFLEEMIQSVLSQDYPYIEHIVMDGGSTDGSVEILRKYAGRLRYESGPDRGQADAINRGFQFSRGQIFAYLNADDTYLPGAIATAVRRLLAHPEAGMVYGEAYHITESGDIIGRYPTKPFDPHLLNSQCYICQPASFLRRDVFIAAGMMNPEQHYALDYDLWMRIARLYPMIKIDEYLATSRMHHENKTLRHRRPFYMEILSATRAHYGYIPFEWVNAYACYLIDGKDQFFQRSQPSVATHALSLLLGSYYNRTKLGRYWKEWLTVSGLSGMFTGRWDDGWISKRHEGAYAVGQNASRLTINGKYWPFMPEGLVLTVRLDGKTLVRTELQQHGPFAIDLECPPQARGKTCSLQIESNRTFRPMRNGDYRKLSCIIDSVTFHDLEGETCRGR